MLHMHISNRYCNGLLLFALFALLLPLAANAQQRKDTEISIAASVLNFGYKEFDDDGVLLDREDGNIPGIMLGLSHTARRWVFAGDLAYHNGDVTYTGHTQTGIPITTRTAENIVDVAMRGEYWPDNGNGFSYAFYLGAGYHYWGRDIKPTTTASSVPVSGLFEIYTWWTGFLGTKVVIYESGANSLLLDARLLQTVNPNISIHFSGQYDNATLALGERLGGRVALPWRHSFTRSSSLIIEPYAESYEFGRSATSPLTRNGTVVGNVYEPRSQTLNYGLTVGVSQHF